MAPADDFVSKQARDHDDARKIAGFFREMERKYSEPNRSGERLRKTVVDVLTDRLARAEELLVDEQWVMPFINELRSQLTVAELTKDLTQENLSYIARALEDAYPSGPGSRALERRSIARRRITLPLDANPTSPPLNLPDDT